LIGLPNLNLVRFAHPPEAENDGLRLVEPTPRREQWNCGMMDSGLRLGEDTAMWG
jgi:hypothetical protein